MGGILRTSLAIAAVTVGPTLFGAELGTKARTKEKLEAQITLEDNSKRM